MDPSEFIVEDDDSIQFVPSSSSFEPETQQNPRNKGKKKSSNATNNLAMPRLRNFLQDSNSTFLADFDPEKSVREKRKLFRKNYSQSIAKSMFDKKGIHRKTGYDACDCLDLACNGCNFPCPNCRSIKCGPTCRSGRKWLYEHIEQDGKDQVLFNPLLEK